ncbi:MAG: glutamate-5-semialdehyde dehydrogenase, partial [Patescibacteria group bacterium]
MALKNVFIKVKNASCSLALVPDKKINEILNKLAKKLISNRKKILKANSEDLRKIDKNNPIYDRILLNAERINSIAESIKTVASYTSPIGKIIEQRKLKSGLDLKKISVPFGVVGVIFEARPNVAVDIFALCLKSKNACILKGGSDAENSNKILVSLIKESLEDLKDCVYLMENNKKNISEFLHADKYVDVIIPRGGAGLIKFVRENSIIPVIETGAGVVHIYFDESGDAKKGAKIIFNAKTSRPSLCNAMDTLIIHKSRLNDLQKLCELLEQKNVEIYADKDSYKILENTYPKNLLFKAKPEDFGKEFLSLKMSVKTVKNLDEAISHITQYGSKHSEAIITENKTNSEKFLQKVDAACVYSNASTRFTDGAEFGLGAEVGVSTQKLHARGPMGIRELTSYKWVIRGNGQIR